MQHGVEIDALGRQQGKSRGQVDAVLLGKYRDGVDPRPVSFPHSGVENALDEVKILLHAAIPICTFDDTDSGQEKQRVSVAGRGAASRRPHQRRHR